MSAYNLDGSNGYNNITDLASSRFYYLLFTAFLANAPVLTGNLIKNIILFDYGDYFKIVISGPTESGFDYAQYLNQKRTPTRTTRNAKSVWYQWVEKTIKETAETFGGSVKYEL